MDSVTCEATSSQTHVFELHKKFLICSSKMQSQVQFITNTCKQNALAN